MHEQRALCRANNSEASEVAFQDGEGAQPLRTTHSKRRKEQGKKACTEFGKNPVTLGLLFLRLCTRSGVPMCRGAVRAYRRSALRAHSLLSLQNVKVIFFFKVPQGFGLYNRASSNPPPPTAKLTNMGLTYLPSPPPGVTAVISVFWVREAFEDRGVGR